MSAILSPASLQLRRRPAAFCVVLGVLLLCAIVSSVAAQTTFEPYLFSTVAGTASNGLANGTGTAARFNRPSSIAVDPRGNLLVADSYNHAIRGINISASVTTAAGQPGIHGNVDGSATKALFYVPRAVALGPDGSLYVADEYNGSVRKIAPDGTVSTIATGLDQPQGIAVDGNSNIYVAETYSHRIIKIASSGASSILAGSPTGEIGSNDGIGTAARFYTPQGIAVDSSGYVYVADFNNSTIRKIAPNGTVTTLAGAPGVYDRVDGPGTSARFLLPGGVAVDSAGNVYVADTFSHSIRKITQTGGVNVSTIAGSGASGSADGVGASAKFFEPSGVAVDASGNILVADEANHEIRKITPGGTVTTIAGVATNGSTNGVGTAARFDQPFAVARDGSGNTYVADFNNNVVRKITSNNTVTTFAGSPGSLGSADGTGSSARFNGLQGIATDANGNVYVADTFNDTIRKITPAGVVTTLAGSAGTAGSADGIGTAASFNWPQALTVDSGGTIYVADTNNNTVRKIAPDRTVTTLAGLAGTGGATDGTGGAARFNSPQGIGVDNLGNLYVADTNNNVVRKITPASVVTTFAGDPATASGLATAIDGTGTAALFNGPQGIAVDLDGNVYVTEIYAHTIRKITPGAEVTTIGGAAFLSGSADGSGGRALFFEPRGVAVDPSGDVYVADTANHEIRRGLPIPVITSPLAVRATAGQPFVYQLQTKAATSTDVTNLPPGLFYDPGLEAILGTPSGGGTFQSTLFASNANQTTTATLTLTIDPAPSSGPVIISGTSATARINRPFRFQVVTTGGSASSRLTATNLPAGLRFDPVTGLISGTPTVAGSFAITLTVTDGSFTTVSTLQLTLTADPTLPVIISPREAAVTPGQPFSYQVIAPAETAPSDQTDYELIGNLPAGLGFDSSSGTIVGTYTPGSPHYRGAGGRELSGGIISNVQLFATNSHGTATTPLNLFLSPTGVVNISTRIPVNTGDNVLIGGFIITGNAPKKVIIRAIGPSLRVGDQPVPGALQDTVLELHEGDGTLLGADDDWREAQEQEIIDTAVAPGDPRESAVVATLKPGNYTAIVKGKNNTTGIGLVEVYDLGTASLDVSSTAKLANISTRGFVKTGDDVMIGGFIVSGATGKIIVRAIGPELAARGVNGALADTTLDLRDGNGSLVRSNDDWRTGGQEQEIIDTTIAPTDDRESAIVATLTSGGYTAIVRGKDNSTGVGLVELYSLQ